MDTTIISGLIAVVGIILSGLFASLVAARQGSYRFNELLYKARLECYPELYLIVSQLAKHIRYATVTSEILQKVRIQLDKWDSQHSLLLSPISTQAIFDLRIYLRTLNSDGMSSAEPFSQKLMGMLANVENAIKTEIGVYSLSDYHNPRVVRDVSELVPRNRLRKLIKIVRSVISKK